MIAISLAEKKRMKKMAQSGVVGAVAPFNVAAVAYDIAASVRPGHWRTAARIYIDS